MNNLDAGVEHNEPQTGPDDDRAWGRLACGLLGVTAEFWLMRYFTRHDAGIGGGPMLLFGPSLIVVVSYAVYCSLWRAIRFIRPTPTKAFPVSRWKRFVPSIAVWILLTLLLLFAWIAILKLTYRPDPPGRYIPLSHRPLPVWLVLSVWTLTPITVLVWFYTIRDLLAGPRKIC